MRSFTRTFLTLLACALLTAPALAQNPTGTLAGRVTDGKEALPGVTVTLTSPSLQGTRTVYTEVSGDYIFKFLPPGEYMVKFALEGFQTIDTTVTISAAQKLPLDAVMPLAQVQEEIVVIGSQETVSTTPQAAVTYDRDLIAVAPGRQPHDRRRSPTSPRASPTTRPRNAITVSGARSRTRTCSWSTASWSTRTSAARRRTSTSRTPSRRPRPRSRASPPSTAASPAASSTRSRSPAATRSTARCATTSPTTRGTPTTPLTTTREDKINNTFEAHARRLHLHATSCGSSPLRAPSTGTGSTRPTTSSRTPTRRTTSATRAS